MTATRFGTVAAFDPERGLGSIDTEFGAYPFHCTELADGSRRIEVGTAVRFVELPKLGLVEAGRIEALGPPPTRRPGAVPVIGSS